jgi:hypothetical protein
LLTLTGTGYLLLKGHAEYTTAWFIANVMALVAVNLERLKLLDVFGVKADLTAATHEAYATIAHLRGLAASVGKITLDMWARDGTWATLSDVKRVALKRELESTLTTIGLTSEQLKLTTSVFDQYLRRKHIGRIVAAVFTHYGQPSGPKPVMGFASFDEAVAEYINVDDTFYTPPAELRRKLFKAKIDITEGINEALLDYEHFEREGTLRRPEVWDE